VFAALTFALSAAESVHSSNGPTKKKKQRKKEDRIAGTRPELSHFNPG